MGVLELPNFETYSILVLHRTIDGFLSICLVWFDFVELVLAAVKGRVSEKQYETGSPNRSFGTCGNLQSEILQTRSIRGHQHVVPTVVFYLLEKNLTVLCSSKEDMCKISLFLYWNHLPLAKTYSVASTICICVVLETISTGWDNQLMLLFFHQSQRWIWARSSNQKESVCFDLFLVVRVSESQSTVCCSDLT